MHVPVFNHRSIPVVWRFFAAYIVIILIILLIVSPIYNMVPEITHQNLLQKYQQQLEYACNQLESQIAGTLFITNVLENMQVYQMLKLYDQPGYSAPAQYRYYLWKVQQAFEAQLNMINVFDTGFLLFTRNNMCVMPHISYTSFEDSMNEQLRLQPEDYRRIRETISSNVSSFSLLPCVYAGISAVPHRRYLTILVRDPNSSVVAGLMLSEARLKDWFSMSELPAKACITLRDHQDVLLFASGEQTNRAGSHLSVPLIMLRCRAEMIIPEEYFQNMLIPVNQTVMRHFLIACAAGLIFSALLSTHSARPIRRIAGLFQQQEKKGNEYQQILAGIDASSQALDQLQSKLRKNTEHLRSILFARLIYGVVPTDNDQEELIHLLPQFTVPYQIALLHMDLTLYGDDKPNSDYINLVARDYLKNNMEKDALWTQLDKDSFALHLKASPEKLSEFSALLRDFSACMDHYGVSVRCGISDVFSGTDNTARAYRQARFRQHILLEKEQNFAHETASQFDVRSPVQVYEAMSAGDRDALSEVFDGMIQLLSKQSPEDAAEQYAALRCAMRCAQRDLSTEIQLPDPPSFSIHLSSEECYRDLAAYADSVLEQVNTLRNKDDLKFVERVTEYINSHFADQDLGVDGIARIFCISRSQLYSVFQKNCTHSIGEMIRKARMEYAEKLLSTTELNVLDISMKCGYSSVNTFCRAFKKHFGVSPNMLRSSRTGKGTIPDSDHKNE